MAENTLTHVDFGIPKDPYPQLQGSGPIKYGGIGCRDEFKFTCYNAKEVIFKGKTIEELTNLALPYWHFYNPLADPFGSGTAIHTWLEDLSNGDSRDERRLRLFFYTCYITGIKNWCFHDSDLVTSYKDLEDLHNQIDKLLPLIEKLQNLADVRCGWPTQNLFSEPIYSSGAATGTDPKVFAHAVTRVKKMIDVAKRLNAKNFVFWGGREGYEYEMYTDFKQELDHLAQLLRGAVAYAKKEGFNGQFLIEPKPMEPMTHQYDFSTAFVENFLKTHNLEQHFKINYEVNHGQLAQLGVYHELVTAGQGIGIGGIDANQGVRTNGWDSDEYPSDEYIATQIFLAVLTHGIGEGVMNFDAKRRRSSYAPIDFIYAIMLGKDTMAQGLRNAAILIEELQFNEQIKKRYAKWEDTTIPFITDKKATYETITNWGKENQPTHTEENSQHIEKFQRNFTIARQLAQKKQEENTKKTE